MCIRDRFYGSIRIQKGLDLLIKALKGIDCNLVVAGAIPFGDSFDRYDKLIENNGINCIKYLEYISEEFTNELFQACELVVLPYKYFYSQSGVSVSYTHLDVYKRQILHR